MLTFTLPLLLTAPVLDDTPPNFEDHVAPILRENCLSCHRGSRAKNGLDLRSVQSLLKGGSGGAAVVPGDADNSLLFQVVTHVREPAMPPDEPPLDQALLDTIGAWITGGARANASDTGVAAAAPSGPIFVAPPKVGEAVLPEGAATQPFWWSERADAIGALAASPTAPLIAVAGHRQVTLYELPGGEVRAVLGFPEGEVTSLRFAASGAVLVAAGGRGAESGLAVGWDVRTGARVFELGDEPDVALDADVTVDHGVVALGGPDRVVRSYSALTGELLHELTAHTDWITAVAYSPDGVLLATGDRAGGVFVWEALTGREFHALPAQRGPVTSLSWRADSMVIAIGNDEGRVSSYEMERAGRVNDFRAHDGVLALQLLPDGTGVSTGRDGSARHWEANGRRISDYPTASGLGTAVCATSDGKYFVVGDFGGNVQVFERDAKEPLRTLRANPTTDEQRQVSASRAALIALEAAVPEAEARVTALAANMDELDQKIAQATAAAEPVFSKVPPIAEAFASAREALTAAEADLARYTAPQNQKDQAAGEAWTSSQAADVTLADARRRLDGALTRAVLTEETVLLAADDAALAALDQARQVAAELLTGATARAQLAASTAAQARVGAETAQRMADAWRERSEPARVALRAARETLEARLVERDAAYAEARAVEKVVYDATMARNAAAEECTQAQANLDGARQALENGRAAVIAAESAWQVQHAAIQAAGGQVPREE